MPESYVIRQWLTNRHGANPHHSEHAFHPITDKRSRDVVRGVQSQARKVRSLPPRRDGIIQLFLDFSQSVSLSLEMRSCILVSAALASS